LIDQPFIHAPAADECENCHVRNNNEHPNKNVKGFSLLSDIPQLCFTCHENYTKKNIHPPVAEGECLFCHSPHASANKSLLLNNQPQPCSRCHVQEIENKKFKHDPVFDGNCQTCHDPHQSDFDHFLKVEQPKICLNCHDAQKAESALINAHQPFTEDCAKCHSPHGSDNGKLLNEKIPVLCFSCHTGLQSEIENSSTVHAPVTNSKQCSNCHSPHASKQNSLLVLEEKELCLSCHNKNISTKNGIVKDISKMLKKGNFIHEPIENGGCVICHNPHNSKNEFLLIEPYLTGQYTNGKSENFALCFSCHDSGLMNNKLDSEITNFRNGNQNLHFLHLQGDKGRNCNLCHNVHGSVFESLISNKVKFGNWEMPLEFKKEQNGGTCNSSCHEEKKYFR